MSKKKKINRAGVVPYIIEDGVIKMLFMLPSKAEYGGGVFQIAKGKFEEGETAEEAAFREASEELGLFLPNVSEKWKLGKFLGRTHVYVAKIKDKDQFGEPHFETRETKWMTPEEFQKTGRNLHKPVIKAVVRMIEDKEGLERK